MRDVVRAWIRRGDRDVLVHGVGLAPLLALSGDIALTACISVIFAINLFVLTVLLMPVRYLIGRPTRTVLVIFLSAMVISLCDRLLILILPALEVQMSIYLGVIAMNILMLDRLDHVLTDAWLDDGVPPGHEWRHVLARIVVTILSVWGVVASVVLVRAVAAHAGFLPAVVMGFSGPPGLGFFLTPGGALVALGLVLAGLRQLGDLEEGNE